MTLSGTIRVVSLSVAHTTPHSIIPPSLSLSPLSSLSLSTLFLSYTPQRSEKQLTIPKEFNFDPRGKSTTTRVSSDGGAAKPVSTLPSRPNQHGMVLRANQAKRAQPTRTQPKPFKFQERLAKQAKAQESAGGPKPYVSVAQNVERFFVATPQRFRTVSKNADPKASMATSELLETTRPVSPNWASRSRAKPPNVLSTEEQTLRDIASRQPFRARPVNSAVMNSAGDLGLPRV